MPQEDSPQADPAPFLETLPSSASAREELMHGLLLLVATGTSGSGEAPKYAGYDARSRQLLQDAARALGVPCGIAWASTRPWPEPEPEPDPDPDPGPDPEPDPDH